MTNQNQLDGSSENDDSQNDTSSEFNHVFSPPIEFQTKVREVVSVPNHYKIVDPALYKALNDQQKKQRFDSTNAQTSNSNKNNSKSNEKSIDPDELQYISNVCHLHFPGRHSVVSGI